MRRFTAVAGVAVVLAGVACGCLTVKHRVPEPIHITVDVNVRVQKELHEFFKEIDELD